MTYDEYLRGLRVTVAPARRAALRGAAARLRAGRVRRPRVPHGGRESRRARPRVRAAARLRRRAARAHARLRDRDARRSGRCASSTRRCARRCASARTSSATPTTAPHAAANESVELVRRATARARRAVHERGHAQARERHARALLDALPDGPLKDSYPDWIAETLVARLRRGGRARAHARAERAARDGRPARRGATLPASRPTSPARTASSASTSRRSPTGGSGRRAAARSSPASRVGSRDGERVLDLCAAPGGKATQLARRGHRGRDRHEPGERAARERRAASGRRTSTSSRRTRSPCRPSSTGFDRALVDAPCSGLGVLALAGPTCAGVRARSRSSSWRCSARRPSACGPAATIVYSVCTMNADENEAVVDASGLEVVSARGRVARVPPSDAGRSSCSRCRMCNGRAGSSSPA